MESPIDHDEVDSALRRCGASWDAAQTHGLLAGTLAIAGPESGFRWLSQVLEGTDPGDGLRDACERVLGDMFAHTYRQLAERQSEFEPLLPDDDIDTGVRTTALAHWCEGFLHGLVADEHAAAVREKLSAEPMADIIRDLLQITRASADVDSDDEANEVAYAELVEYLRVAAQLAYEELAEFRHRAAGTGEEIENEPEVLH
jgi:yecA family protein